MKLPLEPNIAIVGATGAVGREFLTLLVQRCFRHAQIRLLASSRSAGMVIPYCGTSLIVEELNENSFEGVHLAFFSPGGSISRKYAPIAVEAGAVVIDNSSAFRMDDDVPLVVPEINGDVLTAAANCAGANFRGPGVIANPNCSTIIALMAATPLHRAVGIKRMVVNTYQAASGAGAAMMAELEQQAREFAEGKPYTTNATGRQYIFNVFSHDSAIGPEGYNEEEMKLLWETRKIWDDNEVKVTATCVRVPVLRAHCAAINLSLAQPMNEDRARQVLAEAPGVRIVDDREGNKFPEPIDAAGGNDVLVGRIRADISQAHGKGLDLFVAGDQLRKGAALNGLQIAEMLSPRNGA